MRESLIEVLNSFVKRTFLRPAPDLPPSPPTKLSPMFCVLSLPRRSTATGLLSGFLPALLLVYLSSMPLDGWAHAQEAQAAKARQPVADASAKSGAKRALTPKFKGIGLPAAVLGRPYARPLFAEGGEPPLRFLLLSPDLDATGLTLSSDGLLSGVPVQVGTFNFRAAVLSDAEGGRAATQHYRLHILATPHAPAQASAEAPARASVGVK